MNKDIHDLAFSIPYCETYTDWGKTIEISLSHNINSIDIIKLMSTFEAMQTINKNLNSISYNRGTNQIIISEMGE